MATVQQKKIDDAHTELTAVTGSLLALESVLAPFHQHPLVSSGNLSDLIGTIAFRLEHASDMVESFNTEVWKAECDAIKSDTEKAYPDKMQRAAEHLNLAVGQTMILDKLKAIDPTLCQQVTAALNKLAHPVEVAA